MFDERLGKSNIDLAKKKKRRKNVLVLIKGSKNSLRVGLDKRKLLSKKKKKKIIAQNIF